MFKITKKHWLTDVLLRVVWLHLPCLPQESRLQSVPKLQSTRASLGSGCAGGQACCAPWPPTGPRLPPHSRGLPAVSGQHPAPWACSGVTGSTRFLFSLFFLVTRQITIVFVAIVCSRSLRGSKRTGSIVTKIIGTHDLYQTLHMEGSV